MLRRLLKSRVVLVTDEINKRMAQRVIGQLLMLEEDDAEKPIKVFINSPGGDADAGFAIYDIARFIKPPVQMICTGLAASAAVIVLLAATRKNRFSLPNARLLIHQPSTGVRGYVADIQIEASEILKCRDRINRLIADETGQPFEKVEADTRRNFWMSAQEAEKYGLVDKVITSHSEL